MGRDTTESWIMPHGITLSSIDTRARRIVCGKHSKSTDEAITILVQPASKAVILQPLLARKRNRLMDDKEGSLKVSTAETRGEIPAKKGGQTRVEKGGQPSSCVKHRYFVASRGSIIESNLIVKTYHYSDMI